MNESPERAVVLLGVGHTNAFVVRQWARAAIPNCRLICISKFPFTTYSGMLPGTLAGQFTPAEMQIPLEPLVARAGGELILGDVTGLDLEQKQVQFADRSPLRFDLLSVGVGSMPAGWDAVDSATVLPIKPMQTFVQRLDERLLAVQDQPSSATKQPLRIAIVGGGVAGIEIALCLAARLRHRFPDVAAELRIFTSTPEIAEGMTDKSILMLRRLLQQHGVDIHTGARVFSVEDHQLTISGGQRFKADCVIWATGAAAPPVLRQLGLPTDERGFVATKTTLQSTERNDVFAVGDSGTIVDNPTPKAGVFAVRQAPVLWQNIQNQLAGEPLVSYHPQRGFMKILNTGDGKALLEYKGLSFHGRWCWSLKAWIDKRFIKHYQIAGENL